MNKLVLSVVALCLAFAAHAADDCRFSADRTMDESTDGIKRIVVHAGAGDLDIKGESGRRALEAVGKACASAEKQLEGLKIRVTRDADTLVLVTEIPEFALSPSGWFGDSPRIDLTVRVPAGIAVDIEDSSGEATIANLGATRVTDSSGDLRIENIKGGLDVNDSSGEVSIRNVQGPVRVGDGSGELSIAEVMGEVTVTSDGSGSIEVAEVQGSVTIGDDGSGDLRIERVSGSVKIEDDSSGEIFVSTVKHDVAIDHDGSGGIVVENVEGDLFVGESGSGGVRHDKVGGNVRLAGEGSAMDVER
jgi:ribosomal protein S28E/S33